MAGKEAGKEKKSRKRRIRLKRSVRKTFGALFLASAIAVAAIPTEGLQAASGDEILQWSKEKSVIPKVQGADPIYSNQDGRFTFAWVKKTGTSSEYAAVILGYDGGTLTGGELVIPDTVDAYTRFNANDGSDKGYVAVSRSHKPLYYRVETKPQTVSGGDTIPAEYEYHPCTRDTYSAWGTVDGQPRSLEEFWYRDEAGTDKDAKDQTAYKKTGTDQNEQWIRNVPVLYIGNQTLTKKQGGAADKNGVVEEWEIGSEITAPQDGVFAGENNITRLTVGEQLEGIGNYAFYSCATLSGVALGNGIREIGKYAFAQCINMSSIGLGFDSNLTYISDHTFEGCTALQSFQLPAGVQRIYDHAFDGCISLKTVDLDGIAAGGAQAEKFTALTQMGAYVFKNCKALEDLILPIAFSNTGTETNGKLNLNNFEGCSSLKRIYVKNKSLELEPARSAVEPKENYFEAQVDPAFYFEAASDAKVHQYATDNALAFKYENEDKYEKIIAEGDSRLTYQVNSQNELLYFKMEGTVETVTIPAAIGPYGIATLGANSFSNICELKQITIPNTVKQIASGAFQGCHALKWVIFPDPNAELQIGHQAFLTQKTGGLCTHTEGLKDTTPELHFAGPISTETGLSVPFAYAMTPTETIDNDNQPETHITYHSGWPANLEVQYNPKTGANELTNYPTLSEMADGVYSMASYPYLTEDQAKNIQNCVDKYVNAVTRQDKDPLASLNTDEAAAITAAKDLVLPAGITGIREGLFVEKESSGAEGGPKEKKSVEKTITAAGLTSIAPGTFKGHENLVGITLQDMTKSVGDYAFDGCKKLKAVSLPGTVEKLGIRPFKGCESLSDVNFNGGPYFTCDRGILYELSSSGAKNKLVECLEGRKNPAVTAEETAGVTELYPEAFAGTDVATVDLSKTTINKVPAGAFYDTERLVSVTLPRQMEKGTIEDGAFAKSSVQILVIPGQYLNMTEKAFTGTEQYEQQAQNYPDGLIFVCEPGGMADQFAAQHGIQSDEKAPEIYYRISFWYYDEEDIPQKLGETQEVQLGQSATPPTPPEKAGYTFKGWKPDDSWTAVTSDKDYYADYVQNDAVMYNVIFQDYNGKELNRQTVPAGGSATIPQNPYREGYKFDGWMLSGGDGTIVTSLSNVQSDMTLIAQYHALQPGEVPDSPASPGASGSPGASKSPGASGSANPSASPGAFYTLTVENGSGSGSYQAGSQPVIIANNPASGQVFDCWTVSPADVKIASTVLSASILTMPAGNVTVTAHYKAASAGATPTGSGGNNSAGNGSVSGNGAAGRPNGVVETGKNGGTTVIIDKNGLSNTGVVSATVNGSSDNFTVKITETDEATQAALRALMAEYGSLDNVKYFPMDISLYDSTGTNKITDTTGITVDITLPLPDSLIVYAGNNKVASALNDQLEKLDARFGTIDGVSCVTFTAEHFSPYVIYVNTQNLSSGLAADNTPKTGDGIHPKWFLAVGLACLSIVFFMQRDGGERRKTKAKAK